MSTIDRGELIDCKIENRTGHDIFWYHWPRDGLFRWEDFEPVAYIYDDYGDLCLVVLRVGWIYKVFGDTEITFPIQVRFRTPQHHPQLRTTENSAFFDSANHGLIGSEIPTSALRR